MIAKRWIDKGYNVTLVLGFVGLDRSTYYEALNRGQTTTCKAKLSTGGRPIPGYSLRHSGEKVPDERIEEWLCELVSGDGFPYGYRKLTVCLEEDYKLTINHKKVYRLCNKLAILRPQRRIRQRHPKRLAKMKPIDAPNQLWEMDIKYGYLTETDQFFFQLSLIDVFDRMVIDYHLGLSCTAKDACRVLKNSLRKRNLSGPVLPAIRTDNGPQFTSKAFEAACGDLGVIHERIPVKTPNMNAHIEAFHSILEDDCYSRHEFRDFMDAYSEVSQYMRYYNERRRHGSIGYKSPKAFYEAFKSNSMEALPLSA